MTHETGGISSGKQSYSQELRKMEGFYRQKKKRVGQGSGENGLFQEDQLPLGTGKGS